MRNRMVLLKCNMSTCMMCGVLDRCFTIWHITSSNPQDQHYEPPQCRASISALFVLLVLLHFL